MSTATVEKPVDLATPNLTPSPRSGLPPPLATRWKPGESGNPAGKPKNLGASLKDICNTLAAKGLRRVELKAIFDDEGEEDLVRTAAGKILGLRPGDMKDFEGIITGAETLDAAHKAGVDTTQVKKIKRKKRTIKRGGDLPDEVEEETELELHDRSRGNWRDLVDDTDGKPTQTVNVNNAVTVNAVVFQFTDAQGAAHVGNRIFDIRAGVSGVADGAGALGIGGGTAGLPRGVDEDPKPVDGGGADGAGVVDAATAAGSADGAGGGDGGGSVPQGVRGPVGVHDRDGADGGGAAGPSVSQ